MQPLQYIAKNVTIAIHIWPLPCCAHQCYHCYFQATVFFGFLHSGTQLLFQVIWLKSLSKKRECQCFRWPFFSSTGVSLVMSSSNLAQWRVPSVRSAWPSNQTNQLIKDFPSDSIVMVSCIFSSLVVAKSARECHFLCQVKKVPNPYMYHKCPLSLYL